MKIDCDMYSLNCWFVETLLRNRNADQIAAFLRNMIEISNNADKMMCSPNKNHVCKQFYLAGCLGEESVIIWICKLSKHSFIIKSNATYEWETSWAQENSHISLLPSTCSCAPLDPSKEKPNYLFLWFIPNNASDQDMSNKNFYSPWNSMDSTEPFKRVGDGG